MKVTVYVNWNEQEVYSESEYEVEIIHRVEEFCENDDNFAEWLKANYSAIEMFNLEGKQKEEALQSLLGIRSVPGKKCRFWLVLRKIYF